MEADYFSKFYWIVNGADSFSDKIGGVRLGFTMIERFSDFFEPLWSTFERFHLSIEQKSEKSSDSTGLLSENPKN